MGVIEATAVNGICERWTCLASQKGNAGITCSRRSEFGRGHGQAAIRNNNISIGARLRQ